MLFKSRITGKIAQLRAKISKLEEDLEAEKSAFVAERLGEGWVPLRYSTCWKDSEDRRVYLFDPSVATEEIAWWREQDFDDDETRIEFESWIKSLSDEVFEVPLEYEEDVDLGEEDRYA